jgi:hypothetical protein
MIEIACLAPSLVIRHHEHDMGAIRSMKQLSSREKKQDRQRSIEKVLHMGIL